MSVSYRYIEVARGNSFLTRSSSFPLTLRVAIGAISMFIASQTLAAIPANCDPSFARLHISHPSYQASFQALKQDLPHLTDPVQLVQEFSERRRKWNLEFPVGHPNRNGFPAPELLSGVKEVRRHLSQIKRPPENRIAAEKLIRELQQAEENGLPYRDTYRKIEAATYLIQLRFRNPTEKAAAIGLSSRLSNLLPGRLRDEINELAKKHRVENVVPEYDLQSQKDLDKFDAAAAAYFKDLGIKLNSFLKTSEGAEFHRALSLKRQKLDQTQAKGAIAARQLEGEKRELDAILKFFIEDEQRGIQRYINRPDILFNPDHPAGIPLVDESLFETEILLPTNRSLSVEGLAESFMIGITPVQIISRPRRADDLWMDSYMFANHDGFHRFLAVRESQVSSEIINLPLEQRLQILTDIDRLPSPENRSLARTALYLTIHENGSNSNLPIDSPIAASYTRDEFRRLAGRNLTNAEVIWVRDWYMKNVQRRVDHFRRTSPP